MSLESGSLQNLREMAGAELSVKSRLGYVALLLLSAAMSTVVLSLWLTEPTLAVRTQWAFGALTVIGLSWVALSVWVLGSRRTLFARDRVIAGSMAVGFTALFVVGAAVAAVLSGSRAAFGALATGIVMLGIAIGALLSARRRYAELAARRAALEESLRNMSAAELSARRTKLQDGLRGIPRDSP